MRRKRSRKYTWMPILGGLGNNGTDNTTYFGSVLVPFSNGSPAFYDTPIVPDEPEHPDPTLAGSQSLRDLTEGQDWFLKRIVGKLQVAVQGDLAGSDVGQNWPNVFVAAAFFVARASDDDENQLDLTSDESDPLNAFNTRQPWIWRRTWVLSRTNTLGNSSGVDPRMGPSGNWQYGSALDGPHIDAKTARRIRREERLWFTMSACGFFNVPGDGGAGVAQENTRVTWALDYRILGQMRKSTNRSTF